MADGQSNEVEQQTNGAENCSNSEVEQKTNGTENCSENVADDSSGAEVNNATESTQKEETDKAPENADPDGDEDKRKLFVGNLSWTTQEKDVKDYFSKFGDVTSCSLKTDPVTQRSRGFAFVVFAKAATVDTVLEEKNHKLDNRDIDPKRANSRKEVIKKIFCGKVDPTVTEAEIKEYFEKYGKIEKVDLPYDKEKEQRRGFIFISFENEDSIKTILEQQEPHILVGKEIDVKKATPKDQNKGGRGGRGGGRGGYGGQGWGNQGYGNNYYNQGNGSGYGGYGGYGGYDNGYYQGYGGGWEQSSYNNSWGYDQGNQQKSNFGKTKRGGRGGYHPYNR